MLKKWYNDVAKALSPAVTEIDACMCLNDLRGGNMIADISINKETTFGLSFMVKNDTGIHYDGTLGVNPTFINCPATKVVHIKPGKQVIVPIPMDMFWDRGPQGGATFDVWLQITDGKQKIAKRNFLITVTE